MSWKDTDREALIKFVESTDSDNLKFKEVIKQKLLNNRFIIHTIANEELDEDAPDDYFGVNILPWYIIPDAQHNNKTYICYETGFDTVYGANGTFKLFHVIFYVLCDHTNTDWCIDADTGVAKHDLIAALIQDQFNYSNCIQGGKLRLVKDDSSTIENSYSARMLTFEQEADNNLTKTKYKGSSMFANKKTDYSYYEDYENNG